MCHTACHTSEKSADVRIVSWDVETIKVKQQDGSIEHEINMISARVTCTRCEGKHTQGCDICGSDELKMWSAADDDTVVPINKFIDWIMTYFNERYDTITYAHFKAKYYNVHLDHLPKKRYYDYELMTLASKKKFDTWYEQHKHESFYLPDDLKSYCAKDTAILQEAFLKMKDIFLTSQMDTMFFRMLQNSRKCTLKNLTFFAVIHV
uniref:DNA-directed DNA polymerase n=1 Tax=Ditylenchus dipsaci TaxID=166011 RepID=A0A915EMT2_9BILA